MKVTFGALLITALLSTSLAQSRPNATGVSAATIDYCDVLAHASDHDGKKVRVQGFIVFLPNSLQAALVPKRGCNAAPQQFTKLDLSSRSAAPFQRLMRLLITTGAAEIEVAGTFHQNEGGMAWYSHVLSNAQLASVKAARKTPYVQMALRKDSGLRPAFVVVTKQRQKLKFLLNGKTTQHLIASIAPECTPTNHTEITVLASSDLTLNEIHTVQNDLFRIGCTPVLHESNGIFASSITFGDAIPVEKLVPVQ